MKFKLTFTVLFVAFFVASCDKVQHPNPHEFDNQDCKQNNPILKNNFTVSSYRKILVEDYTGHYCGNCPTAAVKAESLIATYGSSVVVLANHVSDQFAKPNRDTSSTKFVEDFRNEASTEWDATFGMSSAGLPKGAINRIQKPTYPQNPGVWSSLVPIELAKPQSVKLDVSTSYDPGKRILDVKVKSTFLANIAADVYVNFVLTQDSIISDQKDYALPASQALDPEDPDRRINYRFDHIVVKSLNGTWGDLLKKSPAVGDTASISRTCFSVNKCFYKSLICINDKQMSLVVFAYNSTTKEILQVEKIKIR
jgi:hypothetical protein